MGPVSALTYYFKASFPFPPMATSDCSIPDKYVCSYNTEQGKKTWYDMSFKKISLEYCGFIMLLVSAVHQSE